MIVLAETLELQKELDKARAEEALKKAMTILKAAASDSPEYAEALAAKARAEARLIFAKDKAQH
jgi:F0F1-type ATP synthase epsilon subunit